METLAEEKQTELLERVIDHIETGAEPELRELVSELHPAENADLLESLPPEERTALWEAIPAEQEGEILACLGDEARATIIDEMDHEELVAAAEAMDAEDLAEVLEELPKDLSESIVLALEEDHRKRLEAVLSYDDDTAGRLMSTDVLSVRPDVTVAAVLRWLRRRKTLPPHTDTLMVVDEDGHFVGSISLAEVVTGDPDTSIEAMMHPDAATVRASDSEHTVVSLFERRDLISVAVLDSEGVLLGRITVDDVVDVIRGEADRVFLQSAGLEEEEDLFAPVLPSAKRRSVWLGINLITVFAAAWVIGNFEEALDKIVALAVLMPVVASMGGIAGSQTLTLTIRGLALDQIAASNLRWLTLKEIAVGALNGVAWALVVALVAYAWFHDPGIAAVIAAAMVLNLLAAAASGVVIPLALQRLGIDPALSGAVVLTTVTDVVGFLSFLGLATLFLL
jgi:magnesium transporter